MPALTERPHREAFKYHFVEDMGAEQCAERDLALVLDCANSHAHGLCDEGSNKNLAAADIELLPEGLAVRTIRRLISRLKGSYELVRIDDSRQCVARLETYTGFTRQAADVIARYSQFIADGLIDEREEDELDVELEKLEITIRQQRRDLAMKRAGRRDARKPNLAKRLPHVAEAKAAR